MMLNVTGCDFYHIRHPGGLFRGNSMQMVCRLACGMWLCFVSASKARVYEASSNGMNVTMSAMQNNLHIFPKNVCHSGSSTRFPPVRLLGENGRNGAIVRRKSLFCNGLCKYNKINWRKYRATTEGRQFLISPPFSTTCCGRFFFWHNISFLLALPAFFS
jgi:hypothetical protein